MGRSGHPPVRLWVCKVPRRLWVLVADPQLGEARCTENQLAVGLHALKRTALIHAELRLKADFKRQRKTNESRTSDKSVPLQTPTVRETIKSDKVIRCRCHRMAL